MRRRIGLILLAALILFLIAIMWEWDQSPWGSSPDAATISAEALADYLPVDAAGVFHLNVRQLRVAPGAASLRPSLRRLAQRGEEDLGWAARARVDLSNLDELRVVLPAKDAAHPLWFLRGHMDTERFQTGPKRLQERQARGLRIWEYNDPVQGPLQLFAGPDFLIEAPPSRMAEWLATAAGEQTSSAKAPVAVLLAKVDRTQALWLAISFDDLGRVGRPENRSLDLIVGPVMRHARTVVGGLSAGEELQGEFTFTTANTEEARSLEEGLKSIMLVAEGAGMLVERDFQPLLHLIGNGTTQRDGTTVTLRCSRAGN